MEKTNLKLPGTDDFFVQEAYKVFRTNLQFCGPDVQVIAITSCNENEGKTTISLGLGKSLAELGKRVLVIDADMRKSVIAGRNTNAKNPAGLSEVLSGMMKLSDCIVTTQYPTLHILFAGKYPPNPVELLDSAYLPAVINAARKAYDYIILDTPPLGRVIDAAVIAPNCDGTVIVLGKGNVKRKQALEVVSQLEKSGGKILGVVHNNSKKKGKEYYYYGSKSGKNKKKAASEE